jgi:tetratricopeptide (TPR) repeat protein
VAELDGTAPADVRAAAKNLVISALEESGAIAALPDDQVRLGLTLAGKPETTRVDVATARELAMRGSVRTVVTGTIDQVGQTYHVAVRVLEADSNRVVATRRDIARGEDDLIPTLDRVVRTLRVNLGEQRTAIAANRRRWEAATPSFAAYQEYWRGMDLNQGSNFPGAVAAYKRALALDTGFAAAWLGLRGTYGNLGFGDSSRYALAEALARKDRLTQVQRFQAEAHQVCATEDRWACLAAFEEGRRATGRNIANHVLYLMNMGRDSEAVAMFEYAQRSLPFGLNSNERGGLAGSLLPLGRFEEARRIAETLTGDDGTRVRMRVAAWTADWPAADSLARSLLERTRYSSWRMEALQTRASVAAARGRVQEALGILGNCRCEEDWLMLRIVTGSPMTEARLGTPPPDTSLYGRWLAALWAAVAGDTATARHIVTRVGALPPERRSGWDDAENMYVEALLAASAGPPAEAVRRLRPLADGRASGAPKYSQPVQWFLAGAYERLGQLDSAAAQLERLATWQGSRGRYGNKRGLTHSFAHQRLVLLYARLGRLDEARRHWRVFSDTFTNPDPELVHLVDEAQAALASAERRN